MGRISLVMQMTADQNLFVDACIRKNRFITIDSIREELKQAAICISRAALQRYMKKLKERDAQNHGSPNDTMIVLIQRSTGKVVNLTTTASMDLVIAKINTITAPA